jgi:hypothetical protein
MYKMSLSQELEKETLRLEFPELPEEIEIKFSNDNKKYNVLALGDIITVGEKGLRDFTIKSLFPAQNAIKYIQKIETMISNKKPMKFILGRKDKLNYEIINIIVVIDEFSYKLEGGEDDISFTLKFTEFKQYGAKVMQ